MNKITIISHLTAALVFVLAMLAFVLSYSSLQHLAAGHGFAGSLSYVWPLLLDFAMVVFSLAILRANMRGEAAWYPWSLTITFGTLATVANVLDVTTLGIPVVAIGATVKALAPIALVLSFELLTGMIRAELRRAEAVTTLAELDRQMDTRRTEMDKLNGQIAGQVSKLDALKSDVKQAKINRTSDLAAAKQAKIDLRRTEVLQLFNDGVSTNEIADTVGVSIKTVKRDIAALNGKVKTG